jgi:hypothetical protein
MLVLLAGVGCGGAPEEPPAERSQRQRDSMLGASQVIPGAAGVRGALRASDSADARNTRRDSLAAAP